MKDGLVESLLYINENGIPITPQGRFDFISGDVGVSFERTRYNLPIYTSIEKLEIVTIELLRIFEDIQRKLSQFNDCYRCI